MVLYQEPSGGTIPVVHQQKVREVRQLVVGPLQPRKKKLEIIREELEKLVKQGLDGAGVLHLLPTSGRSTGGEDMANVDV